ncbi:tRNA lysidine(34) synthetase TilS [uncultured Flavonifractor sp.]|uniref:tRNA lysidine(34) synthetase TilS n=1 Tax=uncultured Flavonifractor sp. TaxID=1193534 RepID=UPI0026258E9C|nr:tRNA lysidine(34) synthetase TilS [uncultured Flavonifractor sp.]
MLETVKSLTAEYDMLPRGGRVLCAVSGGADSICLLHLLHAMGPEGGFTVAAAHYHHGMRGQAADSDAAFVEQFCRERNIPCAVERGEVYAEARRRGLGVEETGRQLRYDFLRRAAEELGCTRIATAHNADDNLETLLLHLVRGAGLHGLAGIPPRRGEIVRPLLTTPRAEIEAYLKAHGLHHVEDCTNTDESYARNRIRRQVVPVLRQLNPRLTESAAETMGYLRADNDFMNAQAAAACSHARWAEDDLVIEARYLAQLPSAIAPRAARRLLEMTGDGKTDCSAAHLRAVVDLAAGEDPSAVAFLPNGRLVQRVYKELLFTTQGDPPPPFHPIPLNMEGETAPEGTPWRCSCRAVLCPPPGEETPGACYLARDALEGTPVLRPRQTGDEIALPRRGGTKTIKKLFIEEKLPRRERELVPILADDRGVLAAAGFGPDKSRLARPGQDAYELIFWKKE